MLMPCLLPPALKLSFFSSLPVLPPEPHSAELAAASLEGRGHAHTAQ